MSAMMDPRRFNNPRRVINHIVLLSVFLQVSYLDLENSTVKMLRIMVGKTGGVCWRPVSPYAESSIITFDSVNFHGENGLELSLSSELCLQLHSPASVSARDNTVLHTGKFC